MSSPAAHDPTYVMGHSEHERERLVQQAGLFGPFTKRFFVEAGIVPGMRVLEVGSGVGDVTLLCAELVGSDGAVVAVERDPAALGRARERAAEAGIANVQFHEGDFRELPPAEPFDAVVGRAVLMYAHDPAEAIAALLPQLRDGGIVAFQEFDYTDLLTLPRTPTAERVLHWWRETATQAGIHLQMGLSLHKAYVDAGLPSPQMHGDLILGGGREFAGYEYLAGVVRSILPLMERFGVATAEEVDVDGLAGRLRDEFVDARGTLGLQLLVGASARKS